MIVTAFSYSRTAQPKQYESVKIEAQGMPGEGQSAVEAFLQLVEFVDEKVAAAVAGANSNGAPLAKPGEGKPANKAQRQSALLKPSPASVAKAVAAGEPGNSEPPFDPDSAPNAEPGPPPKKRRGRPRKQAAEPAPTVAPEAQGAAAPDLAAAKRESQYVKDAETVEELAERYNHFLDPANGFIQHMRPADRTGFANAVYTRYRGLNTTTSDPEIIKQLTAAIKSERTAAAEAAKAEKQS